ncbi:MAG: hypothetical protein AABX99_02255 [Nanoarchaeota archaeon]
MKSYDFSEISTDLKISSAFTFPPKLTGNVNVNVIVIYDSIDISIKLISEGDF